MKKSSQKFSRKIRQFKHLTKQLNRLFANGKFQNLPKAQQSKMIQRLQGLHQKLQHIFAPNKMRKVLAGAAVFLGLAMNPIIAQFVDPVTNPFGLQWSGDIKFATLADVDADGDLDLMTTTYDNEIYEGRIEFYENVGTPDFPAFSPDPISNPFGLDISPINTESAYDFDMADMDDDGDLDLLAGVYELNSDQGGFLYYENIGTPEVPNFAAPVASAFGLGTTIELALPVIADIDDDGDFDVFAGEYYGEVQFFENIGTADSPMFTAPVQNPFGINLSPNAGYYVWLDLADIDNDGDLDLMGGSSDGYGFELFYQENTGTAEIPAFSEPTTENPMGFAIPADEVFFPEMADLDDDGDIDVLLSGFGTTNYTNNWYYFENLDIVNKTNDLFENITVQLFPNPAADILKIEAKFETHFDHFSIEIFDAAGRQIFQKDEAHFNGNLNFQTDVSQYSSGLYLVKIQADEVFGTLKFLKE